MDHILYHYYIVVIILLFFTVISIPVYFHAAFTIYFQYTLGDSRIVVHSEHGYSRCYPPIARAYLSAQTTTPHADPGRTIGCSGVYKPAGLDSRDRFLSRALEELIREQDHYPDISRC